MYKAICSSFFKGGQNSSQQYNIVLVNILPDVCSQLTSEAHKSLIPILVFQWCMRPCIPSYTQPLRSYRLVWRHLRRGQIAWLPSLSYHCTCESNLIKLYYICKICSCFSLFWYFLVIAFQLFHTTCLGKDHWRGFSTRNAHIVRIVNSIRLKMVYTS